MRQNDSATNSEQIVESDREESCQLGTYSLEFDKKRIMPEGAIETCCFATVKAAGCVLRNQILTFDGEESVARNAQHECGQLDLCEGLGYTPAAAPDVV